MWYRKEQTPAKTTPTTPEYRDDFFGLVDDFFRDWGITKPGSPEIFTGKLTPLMNVAESENAYEIETELPGVEKQDVKIEINDNVLTIKGEKKGFNEEKKDAYHRIERMHGSFVRSVKLPLDIDPEKINAKLENGLLHIEVAKHQKANDKKRSIDIC
ncbi:MAG: Hsp20/alpha crystallin family protein [Oligoflexales bacterium]